MCLWGSTWCSGYSCRLEAGGPEFRIRDRPWAYLMGFKSNFFFFLCVFIFKFIVLLVCKICLKLYTIFRLTLDDKLSLIRKDKD